MHKFVIEGGEKLVGDVRISGSKNEVLPILAATLLSEEKSVIRNVPNLSDVRLMLEILEELGCRTTFENHTVTVTPYDLNRIVASYDLVSQMRASFCVLGPLLSSRKRAEVSLPGGCVIGVRPVDLHLRGIKALGVNYELDHGYVKADGRNMRGTRIFLGGNSGSTVTGTANILMAAVMAKGTTFIEQAAPEPEVEGLANMLNSMGAKISGAGSHRIEIQGVDSLRGADYDVQPDRMETATYAIAAAITKGDLTLRNSKYENLIAFWEKLKETGTQVDQVADDAVRIQGCEIQPTDIVTFSYPGFPTDAQAPMIALLATANGISIVTDTIYPDRFMHVAELIRMGADIRKQNNSAIIHGVKNLSGAQVMGADLRATAALVLAGLTAKGTTEVHRIYHLDRGYEQMEQKLAQVGANIQRAEYNPSRRKSDRNAA